MVGKRYNLPTAPNPPIRQASEPDRVPFWTVIGFVARPAAIGIISHGHLIFVRQGLGFNPPTILRESA